MHDKNSLLIPELAGWDDGAGITLRSWISGVGRFDHALGYASIFWPDFVQHEGCILRETPDDANFQEWMRTMAGDITRVEAMMNHLHVLDLFNDSEYQPGRPLLLRLGQILKSMWSCKLAHDFPSVNFAIELDLEGEEMADFTLTFYQSPRNIKS